MNPNQIKQDLEAGKLDKVLEALCQAGKENHYENDTILLMARYNRLQNDLNAGVSDPRYAKIDTNRITVAEKDLIDRVAKERKRINQTVITQQIKPQETMKNYQRWRNHLEELIQLMAFSSDSQAQELVQEARPLVEKIIAFSHAKDRNPSHDIRGEEETKLKAAYGSLTGKHELFIVRYKAIQRAEILKKAMGCVGSPDLKKDFTPVMQDLIGLYPTTFNTEMETFNNLENGPGMEAFAGRITSMLRKMV